MCVSKYCQSYALERHKTEIDMLILSDTKYTSHCVFQGIALSMFSGFKLEQLI